MDTTRRTKGLFGAAFALALGLMMAALPQMAMPNAALAAGQEDAPQAISDADGAAADAANAYDDARKGEARSKDALDRAESNRDVAKDALDGAKASFGSALIDEIAQTNAEITSDASKKRSAESDLSREQSNKASAESAVSSAQGEYDGAKAAYDDAVLNSGNAEALKGRLDETEDELIRERSDYNALRRQKEEANLDCVRAQVEYESVTRTYYGDKSWLSDDGYAYEESTRDFFKYMGSASVVEWMTTPSGLIPEAVLETTDMTSDGDATNVDSVFQALSYIGRINDIRKGLGLPELLVCDYSMACAEISANWAYVNENHCGVGGAECLAIGGGDPVDGWYYKELNTWKSILRENGLDESTRPYNEKGNRIALAQENVSRIIHYLLMTDPRYVFVGCAVNCRNMHTVMLKLNYGGPLHLPEGDNSGTGYTVEQYWSNYKAWFDTLKRKESVPPYWKKTPEEAERAYLDAKARLDALTASTAAAYDKCLTVKAERDALRTAYNSAVANGGSGNASALAAAKSKLDAASARLGTAKSNLASIKAKISDLNAQIDVLSKRISSNQSKLAKLRGATAQSIANGNVPGASSALVSAANSVLAKESAYSTAAAAVASAMSAYQASTSATASAKSRAEQAIAYANSLHFQFDGSRPLPDLANWKFRVDISGCTFTPVWKKDASTGKYSLVGFVASGGSGKFKASQFTYEVWKNPSLSALASASALDAGATYYVVAKGDGENTTGAKSFAITTPAPDPVPDPPKPPTGGNAGTGSSSGSGANAGGSSSGGNGGGSASGVANGAPANGTPGSGSAGTGTTVTAAGPVPATATASSATTASPAPAPATAKARAPRPKGTRLSRPKAGRKCLTVRWAKVTSRVNGKRVTGYQVRYSTRKGMGGARLTGLVRGYKRTSLKVKKLRARTKYYVQVRTYAKVGGKTYYSAWSAKRTAKTR